MLPGYQYKRVQIADLFLAVIIIILLNIEMFVLIWPMDTEDSQNGHSEANTCAEWKANSQRFRSFEMSDLP